MLEAGLLAVTILLSTGQNLLCKLFTMKYPGKSVDAASVYALTTGLVTAVVSLSLNGFSIACSRLTLILGIVNSVFGIILDYSVVKISRSGPYSLQMLFIINGGILIPAIVARAFGDSYSVVKWISLVIIIPAVYLACYNNRDSFTDKKTFFTFCVLGALGNGGFLSMLDIQQRLTGVNEKSAMLAVSYLSIAVVSAVFIAATHRGKLWDAFRMPATPAVMLIAGAVILSAAINLKVYLLTVISSVLLYAFDNVGTLILSTGLSVVFFKDRITVPKIVGCGILSAALILVATF